MDLSVLQTAINTLGFPIVVVLALGWFIWKIWTKSQEQNEKREEKLYVVINKAQEQNEALSNTNAQFVAILNTYKSDLETIKDDVQVIKAKFN